ncbi:ATP-binding protein [Streptomyces sp. ISL-96]|uniref:ATP-binding protein n=1 Tax=Streptomyces sp. ISL-96 TaxID=2819191 RepID=UPI001BE8560D|nr:ATP-binding protein [Streptomyces sp. ISL-96]MBT2488137.1 ATP-binding protein [Streptomyces sp. ISL-96]
MEDPPRPTDVSLVFPPDPVWVRTARETVRTLLAVAGRADLTDAALLLTSEAVTNAVNACRTTACTSPVTLSAGWTDPHRLRVLVHDGAPGLPECRAPAAEEEGGRGMMLISYGADAWGVCTHGPGRGKATWFELGRLKLDRSSQ